MPAIRTLILLGLLFSSLHPAWATNYYVSATGDDSADGLSPATAWATIDKVNAEMGRFGAGDSILFNRGHEFFGSLVVTDEGQAGQPLVIAAYGSGPKPVFTGSRPLADWVYLGDNIWRATCGDCLSMPNSLYIEDKSYPLGRYPNLDAPNKGYLTIDNATGRTTIVDQDLPASPDWSGAEVVVRTRRWILDRAPVGSHVGNTLNLANGGTSSGMLDGYGYFFTNHINTLDQQGEWAYDPRDNYLFLYFEGAPTELRIEVPVLDRLLSIGFRDFITVRDLRFIHSHDVSVLITHSQGNTFTHCDIEQSGHDALQGTSNDDFVCTYNRIVDTNNNGLTLTDCEGCEISYNEIRRNALHPGMGSNDNGEYMACLLRGNHSNFTYNLIDSAGYNGLYFRGSYLNIHRNVVAYSCLIKDDGAGIYTWQDGTAPDTMRRVTENLILHADGAPEGTSNPELYAAEGIYADDHSANLLIQDNTIAFCGDKGIYLHNSYNVDVLHNVVYATARQIYLRHDDIAPTWPIRNVRVKHNIFFGTQLTDINVDLFSWREDVFQFGVIDSNYLVNPHNDFRINQIRYNPTFPNGKINTYNFSLEEWQASTPYDPASQAAPFYLPRFQVDQYLGGNKLTNGDFATDLSGWGCWGNGGGNNCDLSWDANGGLDGGSARFTFDPFTGASTALIRRTLGPVNAGDQFLLRYDIRGAKPFNALELIMIRKGPTFENIAEVGLRPFSTQRSHQEHLFISEATTLDTRLDLKMGESDSLAWLDNIELIPVQTSPLFVTDKVRFEYNDTDQARQITLTKPRRDPKGQSYCEGDLVVIPPYRSVILMEEPEEVVGQVYDQLTLTGVSKPDVAGCTWSHLTAPAGEAVLSIRPNQDLATVVSNVYLQGGALRDYDGAKVLGRNFLIEPGQEPVQPVDLRLYLSQNELDLLIAGDPAVSSVYDLGVIRFSATDPATENNLATDNLSGTTTYIPPADITVSPHPGGYYLEFETPGFSEFWISGSAPNSQGSFPVEFSGFEVWREGNDARLRWTTVSEQNNRHFVVERSYDGNSWGALGQVAGAGNSQVTQRYDWTDRQPLAGESFYRIKQVDFDGAFSHSEVRSLRFEGGADFLRVQPNPFEDQLSLTVELAAPGMALLRLSDPLGREVFRRELAGASEYELNLPGAQELVPGVYLLSVETERGVFVQKLLKQ